MSTSNPSDAGIAQPPSYPTFEELRKAQIVVLKSSAELRIFWALDGPFPAAISSNLFDALFLEWHPISQEPISVPNISSITVSVDKLDQWEYVWMDCHSRHGEIGYPQEGRWYGDLPDYDPEEDSDREEHLLGCCGELRPRKKKATIIVRSASGASVTVHDYLSTLHPWLMGVKGDIESSRNVWDYSLSDIMVVSDALGYVRMEEKAEWIKYTSMVPNPAPTTAYANKGWLDCGPEFGPANAQSYRDNFFTKIQLV